MVNRQHRFTLRSRVRRAASGARRGAGARGLPAPDADAAQEPGSVQADGKRRVLGTARAVRHRAGPRGSADVVRLACVIARLESGVAGVVARGPHRARGDGLASESPRGSRSRAPSTCRLRRRSVSLPISDALGQPCPHAAARRAAGRARAVHVGRARRRRQAPRRPARYTFGAAYFSGNGVGRGRHAAARADRQRLARRRRFQRRAARHRRAAVHRGSRNSQRHSHRHHGSAG